VATNAIVPLPETKASKTSDAIVTLTISGSAAAIKRALTELQG
jgi:hypothetical protein